MPRLLLALAMVLAPMAALAGPVSFPASSDHDGQPVVLRGALVRPDGDGPFPAVVLMHGCGGLQPAVKAALEAHAEALREAAFASLILDSFGPRGIGGGWVCESFDRLAAARRFRVSDATDARDYLAALPFVDGRNVFLMGQSNGGSVAIRLAQRDAGFRAVAAYYPWCGVFNRLGSRAELAAPLIVFGGGRDDWVPPDDCATIRAEGADYEAHVYPDAAHSFDLAIPLQEYQGHLVGHDPAAETDSRRRMIGFFRAHLVK